jgi:hypothetical protein
VSEVQFVPGGGDSVACLRQEGLARLRAGAFGDAVEILTRAVALVDPGAFGVSR